MPSRLLRGKFACIILAPLAAIAFSACSAQQDSGKPTAYLLTRNLDQISPVQADLTLAQDLPIAVPAVFRKQGTGPEIEETYFFDGRTGVEGYVFTSRIPGGSFPEDTMLEMRQARLFHAYVRAHPEMQYHALEIGTSIKGFRNSHLHTVGHYTTASYGDGEGACFFARIGLLLEENGVAALPPGAIDTVVRATLCGNKVDEQALVEALQKTAITQP